MAFVADRRGLAAHRCAVALPPRPSALRRSSDCYGPCPCDRSEPGRCADVAVISRLNPVRFDGGDTPSIAGAKRRSQFFLANRVWAGIGTFVTEAQHVQGSIVLGHRGQARYVSWPLAAVKRVEQPAVQHRLKQRPKRFSWSALAAAKSTSIPRAAAFARAIAGAVSATSTPRTGNPSEATCSAFSPVPQPASSTGPANPPSDATRAIAGYGWPASHGAGPLWYDASQGSPVIRS